MLVASFVFSGLFLALLVLLHFLKPELDPTWRMISEYEIGHHGWMMRLAFFCWGVAVLAILVLLWPSLTNDGGWIGRWWLVLIVLALVGAGIFKTNPITENNPNLTNTLHTLCGSIVILTFPIATTLVVHSLLQDADWSPVGSSLVAAVVLVWIGMAAFFASIIISRMVDPSAWQVPSKVYQGWPNRFLVLTYIAWIVIVGGNALRVIKG
jgi:hypothetical protein